MKVNFFNSNNNNGLLALRVLAAMALLKAHGIPKLMNFQYTLHHIPDPLGFGSTFSAYFAIFTNVICAIMVALGLFTRAAALFILSLTLSGLLLVHFNDSSKVQDVPLIYSITFGLIVYMGAGKYSLDYKLKTRVNEN